MSPRHAPPAPRSNPEPGEIADRVASATTPQSGKGRRWERRPDPLALAEWGHPVRPVHGEGVTAMPSVGTRPRLALALPPHVAPEAA